MTLLKKLSFISMILFVLITSCDPADTITLINDTDTDFNVTINSTVSYKQESFILKPGEEKPVIIFGLLHTNNAEKMKKIMQRMDLIISVGVNRTEFSIEEIKSVLNENLRQREKQWVLNMSCFQLNYDIK